MVVTNRLSSPKASCSGLSASTRPMAEQFGFVTIEPPPGQRCRPTSARWSGVDFRDDERRVRLHAEGSRVRDHRAARRGEARLQVERNLRIERGKQHFGGRCIRQCRGEWQVSVPRRHRRRKLPAHRIGIALAARAVARSEPRHPETRDGPQEPQGSAGRPCRSRQGCRSLPAHSAACCCMGLPSGAQRFLHA